MRTERRLTRQQEGIAADMGRNIAARAPASVGADKEVGGIAEERVLLDLLPASRDQANVTGTRRAPS